MGKTMTGSEQMFLTMTLAAFGFFAVVLAYADRSTACVRDQSNPTDASGCDRLH